MKRPLTLALLAGIVVVLGLMGFQQAAAQSGITVTRGISPSSVPAEGGEVTVTINIDGAYGVGSVVEKLPAGFNYVGGSVMPTDIEPEVDGQDVRFPLLGELSFTYKVMTSASAGPHNFPSGSKLVYGLDRNEVPVGGAFRITVGTGTGTMPGPSDDPCLDTLSVDGAVNGAWSRSCESTDRDSYARYYSFTLTGGSAVTITLESSTDPYLYLRTGEAKSGAVAHENDDIVVGTNINSRIQETLGAGTYTIEAATYSAGQTGSFTLTVSGLGGGTGITVTRGISPSSVPAEGGEVTVTINIDGAYGVGSVVEKLPAGFNYVGGSVMPTDIEPEVDGQDVRFPLLGELSFTYKVMTSASAGPHNFPSGSKLVYGLDRNEVPVGGAFRITVGTGTGTMPGPSDDPCLDTLSVDGAVNGAWSRSCESTDRDSYARYYSFTLTGGSAVTITLESRTDPYLYLRTGEAKSGAVAHENDDIVVGTNINSRIQETLGAGTYTIEAATYSAGQTGSFTLTVSGLGGGTGITVTRGISPSSVPAEGGEVTVTINIDGAYGVGSVVEKLPAGFNYVGGSVMPTDIEPEVDGQDVRFPLLGELSFTYKVMTSASAGPHNFPSGSKLVYGLDRNEVPVGGAFRITVGTGTGTMPGPSDDPCLDTLSVDGAVNGAWSRSCESTDRDSYARYYSFMLSEGSAVTITLESRTDPYLYLRTGEAKSGAVAHENDDIVVGTNINSRIQETLGAGTYTIEAATYSAGQTGSFTLTVSGLGGGTGITVTRGISPSSVPAEGGEVTVSINIDGAYGVGSVVEKLPAGFNYVGGSVMPTDIEPEVDGQDVRFPLLGELSFTYKVMTSASAGPHNFPSGSKLVYGLDRNEVPVGGAFRITVGTGTGTMPGPSDDPCLDTLSVDGAVNGAWSRSCESTDRDSYARYYSFTLTGGSAVTITLESRTDPYLYLREGAAKSGAVAHENDDIVVGTNINSRIQETLGAGTYTIEAATYSAGQTGSFTLTVSGL